VSVEGRRLDRALSDAYDSDAYDSYEKLPRARRAAIAHAVEQERNRIDVDETRTTEACSRQRPRGS